MAVVVGEVRDQRNCGPLPRPKDDEDVPVQATNPKEEEAPRRPTSPATSEAGSDPRGHLWVTWGVYLCAGKPPLADIILSHPPDLT